MKDHIDEGPVEMTDEQLVSLCTRRTTLDELALEEKVPELWTDKSSRSHDYLRIYERYFAPLRHEPIRMLEIGLNKGASIKLWLQYFSQAKVVGVDISEFQSGVGMLEPERFHFVKGDQFDVAFWNSFTTHFQSFDIIIDDGSHFSGPIQESFRALWPILKPGGVYIVEDLGEFRNPHSHTEGYKTQIEWVQQMVQYVILNNPDIDEMHISRELVIFKKRT